MASSANRHEDEHPHAYTMLQGFEWYTTGGGKHWDWLRDNAKRFGDMGITAIWLPPPCKTGAQDSTGYDIYDLWDLGEFAHPRDEGQSPPERTKYGTRAQLEGCMKALRENGIAIYIDAVLNHKMGADEKQTFAVRKVDSNDRTKYTSDPYDIEGWTKYTFPARKGQHSDFQWSFEHFTGVDWDDRAGEKAIYKIQGRNKDWADDVDGENANYDYLMGADVDTAHPDVERDLLNWGAWMVSTFPVSGFRFDAIKHISRDFIHSFVKRVRQEAREKRKRDGRKEVDELANGPITFTVGEFWKDSLQSCLDYLGQFGDEQFSLFDAPLHYNFKEAGDAGEQYDLRKVFDETIVQKRPIDAVTLVENHDTQRGQALESWVNPQFKPLAYALILLRLEGYPCVFLGDLDGCKGGDGDGEKEGKEVVVEPVQDLDKMIKARKLFGYGEQHDYFDHAQCVGWVRLGEEGGEEGEQKYGCAVVMCNGSAEGTKRMRIVGAQKGDVWVDALGWRTEEVEIQDDEGWADFKCHARSVSIWVSKKAKESYDF